MEAARRGECYGRGDTQESGGRKHQQAWPVREMMAEITLTDVFSAPMSANIGTLFIVCLRRTRSQRFPGRNADLPFFPYTILISLSLRELRYFLIPYLQFSSFPGSMQEEMFQETTCSYKLGSLERIQPSWFSIGLRSGGSVSVLFPPPHLCIQTGLQRLLQQSEQPLVK